MNADERKYRNDLQHAQALRQERDVKRVIERLENQASEGSNGLR